MIKSPETPAFNPQAFDDSFFVNYEEQLAGISMDEQSSAALAEILTIEKADGTKKSYEQLRDETRAFFSNEWVRNDEAVMNRRARELVEACNGHSHGAELAQDGQLSSVFERGKRSLLDDKSEGSASSHSHKAKDDNETDPKTGKKKKKKLSWFGVYF